MYTSGASGLGWGYKFVNLLNIPSGPHSVIESRSILDDSGILPVLSELFDASEDILGGEDFKQPPPVLLCLLIFFRLLLKPWLALELKDLVIVVASISSASE